MALLARRKRERVKERETNDRVYRTEESHGISSTEGLNDLLLPAYFYSLTFLMF